MFESLSRLCVSLAELARAYAEQARKCAFSLAVGILMVLLAFGLLTVALLMLLAALTLALQPTVGLAGALAIGGGICLLIVLLVLLLAQKRLDSKDA